VHSPARAGRQRSRYFMGRRESCQENVEAGGANDCRGQIVEVKTVKPLDHRVHRVSQGTTNIVGRCIASIERLHDRKARVSL